VAGLREEKTVSLGRSWLARLALILGALALLLALGDLALVLNNRSIRREADAQRQFIQQTAQLNRIDEILVREIAHTAIEDKDQALRDLLVSHGFRFEAETPAPPSVSQPPADKK
jgi:hypothetical protein